MSQSFKLSSGPSSDILLVRGRSAGWRDSTHFSARFSLGSLIAPSFQNLGERPIH